MPNAKNSRLSPSETLETLARAAVDVAKKARRNHKSLEGDNFYANKLATIRADATNTFRSLNSGGPGDSSAIAELMETIFAPLTHPKVRTKALLEFSYNLRTAWRSSAVPCEDEGLFPLSILSKTKRGYLVTVGRQMNGGFTSGWYDAAAVMMRRIVEISIIEAFEGKGIAHKIKDGNGNYFQLTDLIRMALAAPAWTLSRNTRGALPNLRDVGHMSAHGRYFTASSEDVERLRPSCRIVVEEFLHHAGLL
jgi:hypothetical protein